MSGGMSASRRIQLSGGDVGAWIGPLNEVALKAVTKQGEAVELSVSDVRRLAEALIGMADAIDAKSNRLR